MLPEVVAAQPLEILPPPPPVPKARITALVVDDDDFVLRALPSYLTRVPGVEVVALAKNGLEALERLNTTHAKIVVMDIRMPRMDGFEATRIIRKKYPEVIVVLTSGMEDPTVREQCAACGAHGFMAKMEVTTQFPDLIEKMFGPAS